MNEQSKHGHKSHFLVTIKFMCIFLVSFSNKIHQSSVLENILKMKKKIKGGIEHGIQ